MNGLWKKSDPARVIRGRFRPWYVLFFFVFVGLMLAPQGFVSRTLSRQIGSWLQQHLCVSALGGYSVTGLVLASAISFPLLGLIVIAGFWIRHGLRMVRDKTNQRPGRKPLFDTVLIEGPASVRGGWVIAGAGAFVMLAGTLLLLGPVLGMDADLFLQHPSEMARCKAAA
jgi:hypothetical protein